MTENTNNLSNRKQVHDKCGGCVHVDHSDHIDIFLSVCRPLAGVSLLQLDKDNDEDHAPSPRSVDTAVSAPLCLRYPSTVVLSRDQDLPDFLEEMALAGDQDVQDLPEELESSPKDSK
ncbi:hypothetical protein V6N12_022430 [Hibiscus sabdariffa]|uniref:Uncharacterized protein n=1 Tax=Hibiscus sabdariffa TaxID=183260 RepID=A0ABR2FV88_9ROSI